MTGDEREELKRLLAENRRLRALLAEHGIAWQPRDPATTTERQTTARRCRHQEPAHPLGKLRPERARQLELQAAVPAVRTGGLRDGSRALPPCRAQSLASVLGACADAGKRGRCGAWTDAGRLETCTDLDAAAVATGAIAMTRVLASDPEPENPASTRLPDQSP